MADKEPWKLSEDGYLNADCESKSVFCHPNLNVILLITSSDELIVIDVNSGSVLQRSSPCADRKGNIQGLYLSGPDKLLLTDGSAVGARSDYNGVLLLDTIFQLPLQKSDGVVKLEILCSEALLLQKCLRQMDLPAVYHTSDVLQEIVSRTKEALVKPKRNIKSQKWNTVCLELPHSVLKSVCAGLLAELQRQNRNIPVLPVVSALIERLNSLTPSFPSFDNGLPVQRCLMYSEAARRETFSKWPHMNHKWALPDRMAQAGFYHQPNSAGDDRAMCFTCAVCLVCWESTDEPWSEHERHSPACPFVKGEYTQNVPISVPYATAPAVRIPTSSPSEELLDATVLGTSSVPHLTVTASSNGLVNVWNMKREMKRETSFLVSGEDPLLLERHSQHELTQQKRNQTKSSEVNQPGDLSMDQKSERGQSDCDVPKPPREAWLRPDVSSDQSGADIPLTAASDETFVPKSHAVELTAASVVSGSLHQRFNSHVQPVVVIGVELSPTARSPCREPPVWGGPCDVVRIMNDANQSSSSESGSLDIMKVSPTHRDVTKEHALYLVVYEFYPPAPINDECDDDTSASSGSGSAAGASRVVGKKGNKSVSSQAGGSTKKYVFGTGTSASSSGLREEADFYTDLYDPVKMYTAGGGFIISGNGEGFVPVDGLEFSHSTSMLSPQDYSLDMLQMTLGNSSGGTHSMLNGYLDEFKDGSGKKDKACSVSQQESPKILQFEPTVVQCIPLHAGFKIQSVHPTKDGGHLFVVLSNRASSCSAACEGATMMDIDGDDFEQKVLLPPSVLLLFKLDHSKDVVRVKDVPIVTRDLVKQGDVPVEVNLLPFQEYEDGDDSDDCESETFVSGQPAGLASVICADGKLRILDVGTLRFVAEALPNSDARFVSATYCNNLERICACTETGSLHFFPLRGNEMGMLSLFPMPVQPQPSTSSTPGVGPDFATLYSSELLINSALRLPVLYQLLDLTMCENLTPCYAATFPPCWLEMMQAQKQRRQPQQQHGDDAQHARTWRLQRDSATWDEHLFEITLPKSCTVGHVCFKFTLQSSCSPPPNIQVTLLKQNVSGIGHKQPGGMPVDSKVDFGLSVDQSSCKESTENPVVKEDYLRTHNAEILCGPVNLSQCLDLSDQGGSLILTSPKLLRTRSRRFLLHFKALATDSNNGLRTNDEKPSSKKCRMDNTSAGASCSWTGASGSTSSKPFYVMVTGGAQPVKAPSKRTEVFMGCDWIQEVSIALRRTKRTNLPYERNQRCAMLESNSFIERLLGVVCLEGPDRTAPAQKLALDLLCWVVSIRLSPQANVLNESSALGTTKVHHQQLEVGRIIKGHLSELIRYCFISAGRSIAHKCLKLILVCIEGVKNVRESEGRDLEIAILEALLEWLPVIGSVQSAGALRWFFMLLKRVGPFDTADIAASECVSLLTLAARELKARSNPYHLLLRTRFGLYGTPFEPELFDIDPPAAVKSTSMPLTYASVVQGENSAAAPPTAGPGPGTSLTSDALDLRELLNVPASFFPEKLSAGTNNGSTGNNPVSGESSPVGVGGSSSPSGIASGAAVSSAGPSSLVRLRGLLSSNHYMKGLLEVEPLHFTCHAASDGTKLEKIESGCGCTIPVSNFIPLGVAGTKQADGDFDVDLKWEEMQSKVTQLNHLNYVVQTRLNSIIHGEQAKPSVLLSQEAESSSTSSSQQSSTNSSPWLPQYAGPMPAPTAHTKADADGCSASEDHEIPSCSTKKSNVKKTEEGLSTLLMPWQQLLVPPPQQSVVIERMHSGARRFVVLDFGAPVMLTDLIVPACGDILVLSVDVWLSSEEEDGQRLVVASDVATKALVLSDLQPPPICRYLKITTIGRYGMTVTRCKIPIGSFFGHTVILPGESNPENTYISTLSESNIQAQLGVLGALLEDIHCRYALACSRLRELLSPLLRAETSSAAHMNCYLQRSRDADRLINCNQDSQKVFAAYQECISFQHQLNVVKSVIARLESAHCPARAPVTSDCDSRQLITQASTDQLRVLSESLLDALLYLGCLPRLSVTLERPVCEQLFYWLCVGEDTRMQLSAATLLVRLCAKQQWWGCFLADTVANLFSSNNTMLFPQDRVFILLAYLGRKSLSLPSERTSVLDAILRMFGRLLEPLSTENSSQPLRGTLDLALIGWALLFVSQCLDVGSTSKDDDYAGPKDPGLQSRWDFIQGEVAMQKRAATGVGRQRSGAVRSKRMTVQKQPVVGILHDDFEAAKKACIASTQALSAMSSQAANLSSKLDMALKHQEHFFKKALKQHPSNHLKETVTFRRYDAAKRAWTGGVRRNVNGAGTSGDRSDSDANAEGREALWLPQAHCLPVARGLVALLLHMDFTCNMDMFLLTCKVLARIVACARPALALSDLMTSDQLLRLLRIVVCQHPHQASWGGPWAAHAITCLLQDILEGVRAHPVAVGREEHPAEAGPSHSGASQPVRAAYGRLRNSRGSSSLAHSSSAAGSSGASAGGCPVEKTGSADTSAESACPPPDTECEGAASDLDCEGPPPVADFPSPDADYPGPSNAGSGPSTSGVYSTAQLCTDAVADLLDFISKNREMKHDTEDMVAEDCPDAATSQAVGAGSEKSMVVLESDDSELEDFLDDILEHGRSLLKKGANSRASLVAKSRVGCISTAMDARLDYAVDSQAEVMIRRLVMLGSYNLTFSVNSMFPMSEKETSIPSPPPSNVTSENEPTCSLNMLIACFDKIFELQPQNSWTSLELVLNLWITLNVEGNLDSVTHAFDSSACPIIVLSPSAVSGLLTALSWQPEMSVRTWSLAFQCLTQVSNTPYSDAVERWGSSAIRGMANVISCDPQFSRVLLRFLSGGGVDSQHSDVGPTVCTAMRDLLVRLLIRTDVGPTGKQPGWMSNMLLQIALSLIAGDGAVSGRRGPLDAQCAFFHLLLGYNFTTATIDVDLTLSLLEAVGMLVHTFIVTSDKVRIRSVSESNHTPSMCFGGLLSHVIGGELKAPKTTSWDTILSAILKLCANLVQARLNRDEGPSESMEFSDAAAPPHVCQTDEHKAKQLESGSSSPPAAARPTPCVADSLLQRPATMVHLLSALAGCAGSPLAVLLGTRGEREAREPRSLASAVSGDPLNVGDGIFLLLFTLYKKASAPQLLLRPLYDFLSSVHKHPLAASTSQPTSVLQLSEPLLWFILKVLDTPESLVLFNNIGGIKVICDNLVQSSRLLLSSHPSLVSVVMQHLSRGSSPMPTASRRAASTFESYEGLQNFAPLGTISSSSSTAQSADVLIQATPSQRRARNPAWSYHFYPDEMFMDLTLRLPCAILLREVQLQPHLTSLATCPSAVGLEVSRDGYTPFVPLSAPIPTSGTTFVRLTLDRPEVVTCVLLRLYRPHDSTNIGLSQVRLLGSTTFGETSYRTQNWDVPEEEHLTKTSLGWLRLLHQCLVVGESQLELQSALVASAAQVDGLLDACGGLLMLPVPVPPLLTTALEHVLLRLGLHSRELGLRLLHGLLRSSPNTQLHALPSVGSDSVVDLIFLLGTTRDAHSRARIETMLTWLQETGNAALSAKRGPSTSWSCNEVRVNAACIHSIAAVLWDCHKGGIDYDLAELITYSLFISLYQWTLTLPVNSSLKPSLDAMLCSMCCIQPVLFSVLLKTMGATSPNAMDASVSDDTKDMQQDGHGLMTDDRKEELGEWTRRVNLSEGQMMTIALASQSPAAVKHLLDSGLPGFLAHSLLSFCLEEQESENPTYNLQHDSSSLTDSDKAHGSSVKTMASILKMFAELCSEGQLRDWLGSSDGCVFWLPLLKLLCGRSSQQPGGAEPESHAYAELEMATLQFLSRCCSCHPNNQQRLASVLCDVISQQEARHHNVTFLHGVSGFARRLVLQLLLESERLRVLVHADFPLQRAGAVFAAGNGLGHPSHGIGHHSQLLILSTQTTCAEIIRIVVGDNNYLAPLLDERTPPDGSSIPGTSGLTTGVRKQAKGMSGSGLFCTDPLSFAAGVTAKDKRSKDAKNAATRGPFPKKTRICDSSGLSGGLGLTPDRWLEHPQLLPGVRLPGTLTLAQLLRGLRIRGHPVCVSSLDLTLRQSEGAPLQKDTSGAELTSLDSLQTPLQVFTAQGGLALLAQHLPLVYPETLRYSAPEKPAPSTSLPDPMEAEWVKVDSNNDWQDDLDDSSLLMGSSSPQNAAATARPAAAGTNLVPTSVPPHSLAAFGLFLRLPGYAEVLLRDRKKAQCLLRLVLGVSDDGEGGDILTSPVVSALPTLPFQVLRQLLDSAPLHTDDGVLLRRTAMDIGAVHLLLACLSVFTHQSQDIHLPGVQHELVIAATKASASGGNGPDLKPPKTDEKSQLYWAKGTGFGTGSTAQSWNVEQALLRQRSEEEHVTVLLQAISSCLNPGDTIPPCHVDSASDSDSDGGDVRKNQNRLPPQLTGLLQRSCLLAALCSYLRNDSVLDMARHIPLYRAVLQVLRALATNPQLTALLLPADRRFSRGVLVVPDNHLLSASFLLTKMKGCVDTYASRLKYRTKGARKAGSAGGSGPSSRMAAKFADDLEQDEGLAQLIADIQHTANLVQSATDRLALDDEAEANGLNRSSTSGSFAVERPSKRSLEERYLEVMQKLQFDTFEMITESSDGGFQFAVSYHFESNLRSAGDRCHPARVKRLAQEAGTLSTSLPLSYSSSVYVRCDSDRLDIMKVLITGPAETPYANGCFEFDVYFPPDYPNTPMLINMETTGHHTIRFNPNLYNDGKVCLSVLNTWHGRPEEKWNAQTSSFLQVLVSIQSLILVSDPYFNEPGFERSRGTPSGTQSSREYNANICQASVRWAMLEQVRNPCPCFREVIHTHFWFKKHEVLNQIELWIGDLERQNTDRRNGRAVHLSIMALRRHYEQLKEELNKLKPPPGLEDLAEHFEAGEVQEATSSKSSSHTASATGNGTQLAPPVLSEISDVDTDMEMEKMVSKVCE